MVEEAYVSFATAKLLKERGFNESCRAYYSINGKNELSLSYEKYEIEIGGCEIHNAILAPTQQMAMRWLREEHHIHIELNWEKGNQLYGFQIFKPGKYQPEISSLDLWRIYKNDNYLLGEWKYEEAVEEAIKFCLKNLI